MAIPFPPKNGGRERTLYNSYRVAVAVLSFQENDCRAARTTLCPSRFAASIDLASKSKKV